MSDLDEARSLANCCERAGAVCGKGLLAMVERQQESAALAWSEKVNAEAAMDQVVAELAAALSAAEARVETLQRQLEAMTTHEAATAAAEVIIDALLDAGHNGMECDTNTPLARPVLEAMPRALAATAVPADPRYDAPPPPQEAECCASGSCEVCRR